jgi:AcrR family transcriptional regulator
MTVLPSQARTPPTPGARGRKRRAQVMDIAATMFEDRGYHETSMESIAEAVGVRKASLYYYFASKDDLLVEIHQEMINLILDKQRDRVDAAELSSSEMLLAIMTDLISLMESHPGHLRIFFEHFRELPAETRREIAGKRDGYRDMLITVLEDGREAGEFTFDDSFLTAMLILGMCNWTYQWFDPNGAVSAKALARLFYRQAVEGFGTMELRARLK